MWKTCPMCKRDFVSKRQKQVFCSRSCLARKWGRNNKEVFFRKRKSKIERMRGDWLDLVDFILAHVETLQGYEGIYGVRLAGGIVTQSEKRTKRDIANYLKHMGEDFGEGKGCYSRWGGNFRGIGKTRKKAWKRQTKYIEKGDKQSGGNQDKD